MHIQACIGVPEGKPRVLPQLWTVIAPACGMSFLLDVMTDGQNMVIQTWLLGDSFWKVNKLNLSL